MSTTTSFRTAEVEAWGEDCVGTDATGPLDADTYDFELLDCLLDFKSAKDISSRKSERRRYLPLFTILFKL